MRWDIHLLEVLEPAEKGDAIMLEEADWAHLKMKVELYPFAMSDRRVVETCDAFEGAPAGQ